ncbi:FtsQ-type POTRA domain-containing protein [Cryobacterium sp. 1639]|uniref:FtsQ-type POTRA domain-containing protein n=1 Tax=Cryobacterium inferilacus TaxID=2866629 RepID=UPI001C732B81|nr:FtsQ-type POTRA domain-containing protein [Cryobacterium sp. 1639]MBX0298840.1 FtsQ-type POTRA domain-containing protein [Cryobacterium sp. 1639]
MKRPAGIPQSPRPATPRQPDRATPTAAERRVQGTAPDASAPVAGVQSRSASTGRTAKPTGRQAQRSSEPDATTEPITVVLSSSDDRPAPAAPAAPGGGGDTNASVPTAPASVAPGRALPATDVGEPGTPAATPGLIGRLTTRRSRAATPDAPLTAREARARLRAARRARKQYERSEVRRFTTRSRRRRNLWLVAAGTTVALVAFVLVGVFSPLMALRTIEVTGTSRIPAEDIVQALDGQVGTPLPLLDFAEVKGELSEFSLIRSYVTESRPPDTLVVRIVEREPVGTIASAAGFDLVDAAGVVITSGVDRAEGPLIDAANGAGGAGFPAAVAVIAALPEGIRSQLDTVTAATKDDVTLTLVGGARVVWGNSERADYKAIVLSALLVSHPVGSVTEYDVSSPDSAVVR